MDLDGLNAVPLEISGQYAHVVVWLDDPRVHESDPRPCQELSAPPS
jgi:hypothetical protein